jgi:hypothetical protein
MKTVIVLLLFVAAAFATQTNPNVGACDGAKFRTGTEGQWGDPCMTDPTVATDFYGCLRDDYFPLCVGTLVVGCKNDTPATHGFTMTFTDAASIDTYVPQLGPNSDVPIHQNWVNPPQFINPDDPNISARKGVAGNFGGNLVALAMNLAYDKCIADTTNNIPQSTRDKYNDRCFPLGDLHICDDKFLTNTPNHKRNGQQCTNGVDSGSYSNGQPLCWNCASYYDYTIFEIFELAQRTLGGCCHTRPPPHLICDWTWATHTLKTNVNYIVGDHSDGAVAPPYYCFRIDNLEKMVGVTQNWEWTFSCNEGNLHFMIHDPVGQAPTACGDLVWTGTFTGGRDAGNNYSPWSIRTWSMDYTIKQGDIAECLLGVNGHITVSSKAKENNNMDIGLSAQSVGQMVLQGADIDIPNSNKKIVHGFTIDIRPKAADTPIGSQVLKIHTNHRGVAGQSIEGWHQFKGGVINKFSILGGAKDWLSVICDLSDPQAPQKRNLAAIKDADCDPDKLNACMTLINQAFQSGQPIQAFHGRTGVFQLATCTAADP